MGLERLKKTPPGAETQLTADTILFDQQGEPLVTVVDGQLAVGVTEAYLAVGRMFQQQGEREWKRIRRKRKPTIIGL